VSPSPPEPRISDETLVRDAQRGDVDAFSELVTRYQDRVYNTVYRMCNNHADALDCCQAAFLRAFEALPRYEARSSFFTWIFRIAVNAAISQRRARRSRPVQPLEDAAVIAIPAREGPEAAPDLQAERASVAEALAGLEEDYRAAVVLRDVEGLDYSQIAEVLNVPVGTVKSRLHRGRQILRQALASKELQRDPR